MIWFFNMAVLLSSLVCYESFSAPIPGVGSSMLVSPADGIFYSIRGFRLKTPTPWVFQPHTISKEEDLATQSPGSEFSVTYRNPELGTARFSLQTDTLKSEMTLENYTKKWMKDYSSYGFDVLGVQPFKTPKTRGLVVDLQHRKKASQIRQAIYMKNKTAVILTCVDQQKNFSKSLSECNQMVRGFDWNN